MRPLTLADAEPFAALVRLAFTGLAVTPPPSASRVTADDIRQHLEAGGGGVIEPGQGGVLWAERDGALYVSRLAVHPAHRRKGLATAFLAAAEAEAIRRHLPCVRLSTRLAMESNRRLFCVHGYIEGERHAHPGYAESTFVDLEKRLS